MLSSSHIRKKLIPGLLVAVFLFALISQGMHQLNNPAKAPRECGTTDSHFHQHPFSHSCDLCDYKTSYEHFPQVALSHPFWIRVYQVIALKKVSLDCISYFLQRGPPLS